MNELVVFKCGPQKVYQVVASLNGTQKELVKELSFGHLLRMPDCRLPRAITLWLTDLRKKKKALIIRGKPIKVTSLVKKTLGLLYGSIDVPMPRGRDKPKVRN